MLPSLRIGRPFGINVFIHWSFWLLPLWLWLTHDPEATGIPLGLQLALVFALFFCVILHELGHSLTARAFGIATHSITLLPIGGVARLERTSWSPWEEFCIAVAGPLVNVAIAAGLGVILLIGALVQPGWVQSTAGLGLFALLGLNLMMVVFNLIPAFPMDGGRVLRSLLATAFGPLPATRVAVVVGTVMAFLMFGVGALSAAGVNVPLGSPWLMMIGLFVLFAGPQELYMLAAQQRRREAEPVEVIPMVLPVEQPAPAPAWAPLAARVTVFIWDAQTGRWVRQGTPPAQA